MHHVHLKKCDSTQIYLKENAKKLLKISDQILISTDMQLKGVGRSGNKWDQFTNGIAFSFILKTSDLITLMPLWVGLSTLLSLEELYGVSLSLKWPNDLLIGAKLKCGGIICNYYSKDKIIVGIGLNLGLMDKKSYERGYKFDVGSIVNDFVLGPKDRESIPEILYKKIIENLNSNLDFFSLWNSRCAHMNTMVEIENGETVINGEFKGIGSNGEALIKINSVVESYISGSLKF